MKKSKKLISALLLIAITVSLIIFGFSKISNKHELSKEKADKLLRSFNKDINVGELEVLDVDNNGSYDEFTLNLDKEKIEDGLFLNKKVKYKRGENGFIGTVILEFNNENDETKKFSYTENIPKSFAAHVDDLEFSIPPTKIINPDPEVSWTVEVIDRNIKQIVIKAKVASALAVVGADPGGTFSSLFSIKSVPSEKMVKAGQDAAIESVLENLDDFAFIKALNDCNKFEGALWNSCLINLMVNSPNNFIESDCEKIDIEEPDAMNYVEGSVLRRMCKAVVTKDWEKCHDDSSTWGEVDLCKQVLFKSMSKGCEYVNNKDECIYNAAIESDSEYGCGELSDKITRSGCLAELTQDYTRCVEIEDGDARNYCCDKILDEGARKECLGTEKGNNAEVSCETKPEGQQRDLCLRQEAKNNCDTSICISNFTREYDQNECIQDVARECGINYCLDMKDSKTAYNKVSCIYMLAKNKKDCELIGDSEYDNTLVYGRLENQKTCLERF